MRTLVLRCHPLALIGAAIAELRATIADIEVAAACHQLSVGDTDIRAIAAELDALRHPRHVHADTFSEALLA